MLKTSTCEKCGYSLNINKVKQAAHETTNITAPVKFVKYVKGDLLIDSNTRFVFTEKDLVIFLETKTSDAAVIAKYVQAFRQHQRTSTNAGPSVVLECHTCGTTYPLPAGTTIYSMNFGATDDAVKPVDVEMALMDPTLPRTKDYVCRTPDCKSHREPVRKEAVIWKNADYITRYICTMCSAAWAI